MDGMDGIRVYAGDGIRVYPGDGEVSMTEQDGSVISSSPQSTANGFKSLKDAFKIYFAVRKGGAVPSEISDDVNTWYNRLCRLCPVPAQNLTSETLTSETDSLV